MEPGWRGRRRVVAAALLAAERGNKFYGFARRERSSWAAATLLGPRCVL